MTTLQMTLVSDAQRLTSYGLQTLVAEICTNSIEALSKGLYRLELVICSNEWLIGMQQVNVVGGKPDG